MTRQNEKRLITFDRIKIKCNYKGYNASELI